MKVLKIIFLPLLLVIMLSSCTQIIDNYADEIRLNKWSAELENENSVTLKFKEDNAVFEVVSKDKQSCVKLKGLCIIDKSNIMISDKYDGQNYIFSYKLKDNRLKLTYNDGTITLKRK